MKKKKGCLITKFYNYYLWKGVVNTFFFFKKKKGNSYTIKFKPILIYNITWKTTIIIKGCKVLCWNIFFSLAKKKKKEKISLFFFCFFLVVFFVLFCYINNVTLQILVVEVEVEQDCLRLEEEEVE